MHRAHFPNVTAEPRPLPGRTLWMLAEPAMGNASRLSMCVIRVQPGETVHPAHSHPGAEELIYILKGEGEAFALSSARGRQFHPLNQGTAIVFLEDDVHMIRNKGTDVMEVACFFSPACTPETYRVFDTVRWGDEKLPTS